VPESQAEEEEEEKEEEEEELVSVALVSVLGQPLLRQRKSSTRP